MTCCHKEQPEDNNGCGECLILSINSDDYQKTTGIIRHIEEHKILDQFAF